MSAIEDFDSRIWDKFAKSIGVSAPFVRRRVASLSTLIESKAHGVADRLSEESDDRPILARLVELTMRRADQLRRQAG